MAVTSKKGQEALKGKDKLSTLPGFRESSQPANVTPAEVAAEPATRRTIKRETKSKRINLLVRPSVYEEIVAKAEREGVSVNELINAVMENIVKE